METSPTALILTKLHPPPARARTVQRARLLQRLTIEPGVDLALICAPAGYGKTTLLVEWAHRQRNLGMALAWISLDEGDNNPITFAAYLVASLEQALGPGCGLEPVGQVLRASPEVDLLNILTSVVNVLCASAREVLLVLDDYHLIRTPAIHQAVEFLIDHRPENLHLAVGSRVNPPLPLNRLRARGRLIELRAPDLRFREDETGQFLRDCMRLEVAEEWSKLLAEQVEGWAAGLQLAALSLLGRPAPQGMLPGFTGRHRQLAEYLLNEVVNQLPESLQTFLLYSSVLERMSALSCDAILGVDHSAAVLRQLEQANLFISALDEEGTWYRYHHLFRSFLRDWLEDTQPEKASALHRAAAGWFAAHGSLREAAYHAFRCRDWSFAADFVELHSFTLIVQSEIATIYEWTSTFPENILLSRARLCIFQALALAYRSQGKYHHRVQARLRQALAAETTPDQALEVSELAGVVQAFLAMIPDADVDARAQLTLAETHLAALPSSDPGRFSWLLIAGYAHLALLHPAAAHSVLEEALPLALQAGLFFGLVEVHFHLARLGHSCGQLADTLDMCRKAQEEISAVLQPYGLVLPALGGLDIASACILIEQGNIEAAEQHLRRGVEQMGWGINPYYLMTASLAQFRIHELRGQTAEALACLDQLDTLWPDIQFLTDGLRAQVRFHDQAQDPRVVQFARDWLQSYGQSLRGNLPPRGLGAIGASEAYYQADLTWLRLQIALGEGEIAASDLESQLSLFHHTGLVGREIDLLLLQAQLYQREGNQEQALAVLEMALTIGQRAGYVSVFDQGAALDSLMRLAEQRGFVASVTRQVLSAMRAGNAGQPLPTTRVDQDDALLSKRELDVLRLIATGATNQEIAACFVISIGTVKSHINHILNKLDAGNRTEAVAKARHLGLLNS